MAADAGVEGGVTGGEEAEEDSVPTYEYDLRFGVPVRDGDTVTCLHRGSSALDKLLYREERRDTPPCSAEDECRRG